MTFVSYAQNFEDVLLWRALGDVRDGFYIDIGAWHPDTESVTRAFYDRGWRGINVEPVPENARRLRLARTRDITLQAAVSAQARQRMLHIVPGTGLSSLSADAAERARAHGYATESVTITTTTLAEICAAYAPPVIHFLKIDVEGEEAAVLAGADFDTHRPWIVLVEAVAPLSQTAAHFDWEPTLLRAHYRFVWFDGLNRYYLADERFAALAPHFDSPPNVFDDFLRAADTEWVRRIGEASSETEALRARLSEADRATSAAAREAERLAGTLADERQSARAAIAAEAARARAAAAHAQAQARAAAAWMAAIQASTSWRVTAPIRRARSLLARLRGRPAGDAMALPFAADLPDATAPPPDPVPKAAPLPVRRDGSFGPRRAVHQFHSGTAVGDAITNAMFLLRAELRRLGYASEIFVEHRDPALADECRLIDELPLHDDYVLIVRHSMGYDGFSRITKVSAPKLLIYHNITPPEFLADAPILQDYARLGREQLAALRPQVLAALADSDYNALELHRLGFAPVRTCPLLFDVDALLARAAARPPRQDPTFTLLFVGRVAASKAQADLVAAYAEFRARFADPSRLVLVGRADTPYAATLREAAAAVGIGAHVVITGAVSDAELDAWYGAADLYVSLSHHEGFGVPLIEAMAHGVPVVAWPSGAVPYTLGDAAELLTGRAPGSVGAVLATLAADPEHRAAIAARQRIHLDRFRLDRHLPVLQHALAAAGAPSPLPVPGLRETLARNLRLTVLGHINGSYSLAAVNRRLAAALEAALPGAVRIAQVEAGHAVTDLSLVPQDEREAVAALAARPAPESGPSVVISQHYPVFTPPEGADAALAFFFWEESVVPPDMIARLNADFAAVLAPSAFVAKVLVDSGLARPVHVVGHAPDLSAFAALPPHPPGLRFTFLHVSSGFPRKGVDALLAAWARAFRGGDGVRLVIKGFPNPHNTVADQIAALRARDPDIAEIELIDRDLGPADLVALYTGADAVVLPTRGEGFNLPAAEALAAGRALIVTAHGGHADFCTEENARLVDYRFAPAATHFARPGSVWADPDIDDLTRALREAVATARLGIGTQAAIRRVAAGRATVAARLSPAAWSARVIDTALDTLLRPPPPRLRLGLLSTWDVRCGIAEYTRQLRSGFPDDSFAATTVFADQRSTQVATDAVTVRPSWGLRHADNAVTIAAAVAAADPHVLAIQHQPGLLRWADLAQLLAQPAIRARPVAVTLHNTRHLLDLTATERDWVTTSLAAVARVVVHTVADLNVLKQVGLTDNTTLLPHGTPPAHPAAPARKLMPDTPLLIGSYGFMLPDKGVTTLIEAFVGLHRHWPRARLRLVNAEYDTPESAAEVRACHTMVTHAGLEDAVEWHTEFLPNERSIELLGGCDVVALPYRQSKESSSASLRTALCAGVPVIATPLAIFDEAEGAVARFSGVTPPDVAAGLNGFLADQGARAACQRAARDWLAARDWNIVGARYAGMLVGLCRQNGW
jgi:FkbM family methyltransferase